MGPNNRDTRTKTVVMLDASALKNATCIRELFFNVVIGYYTKGINNDTHLGSCVHKFRSIYRVTGNELLALHEARKHWKKHEDKLYIKPKKKYITIDFMQSICLDYASKYQPGHWGDSKLVIDGATQQPLVEPYSRFIFPFKSEPDVDIMIAGTMDEVDFVESTSWFSGSSGYTIEDLKVSGAFNTYQFFDDYILNPQLIMYRWAIKKYAAASPNSIWAKIDKSPNVGARIDGIFYRAPKQSGDDPEHPSIELKRGKVIIFKDWMLDEFEKGVSGIADKLIHYIRRWKTLGELPPREGMLTNHCGDRKFDVCNYCSACSAIDDEQRDSILEQTFDKRLYNPMTWE